MSSRPDRSFMKPTLVEDAMIELPRDVIQARGGYPSVFIMANGCPENRIDAAYLYEFLRKNGFALTADFGAADLIIFSACALTIEAEERSLYLIRCMQSSKKPTAGIIICGCLPKINPIRLGHVHKGFTFDSNDNRKFSRYFSTTVPPEAVTANRLLPKMKIPLKKKYHAPLPTSGTFKTQLLEALTYPYQRFREQRINAVHKNSFLIKIATGCSCHCSFCAVRRSRGKLRSKPLDRVLAEFDEGRSQGCRDIALIGTSTGSYGTDLGIDLCVLLEEIMKRKGDYQISLRNIHPKSLITMWTRLGGIFESGKVAFLSTAVQSGSSSILKRMKRDYDIEEVEHVILALRQNFPKIRLRTQVMVGFPGETDKDFSHTVRFLERVHFDFVEVYLFQPRPGTEAMKMENRTSYEVAMRRYHEIFARF